MTASQKLGEKMYADMQARRRRQRRCSAAVAGSPRQAAAKPADDNVVDAEFKEVKK
jgi:molecular chaperone DnaK